MERMGRIWNFVSNIPTLWGLLPSSWQVTAAGAISAMTAWFGYREGGVFYALIGASLVFTLGMFATFLWVAFRRLTSVYERITVEQIGFAGVNLHRTKDGRNKRKWLLKNVTFEINLKNHSNAQTLYFTLKRETHSLDGKSTTDPPKFSSEISIVPPQTVQKIILATLPDVELKDNLRGLIDIEIFYGPAKDDLRYLFIYQCTPIIGAAIQKDGRATVTITAPILKHDHTQVPMAS